MPTNDERRAFAATLRVAAGNTAGLSDGEFVDIVEEIVLGGDVRMDPQDHNAEVLNRLADLIEPEERTCHIECVKSGPFYDVFRFDCCGKEYSESRTDDGATELPLAVCPFCGARVVADA